MAEGSFGTVINCMDGRTQEPAINYVKETYGVDYVDSITEPGPVKIMHERSELAASIKARLDISLHKHGSSVVVVVAHHNCAGNPVPKERQMVQLDGALVLLREWGVSVETVGLWIGEDWKAEKVM